MSNWPLIHWAHGGFYMKGSDPPPDPEKVREWLEEADRLCGFDPEVAPGLESGT